MSEIVFMFWIRFFSVNRIKITKPHKVQIGEFRLFKRTNVRNLVID
jgi:hypothetical protein